MSSGISDAISNAASSPTGRLSQTKYYLSSVPSKITVIRRHHPLQGRELEVLSGGKVSIVVRLADGSSMKLPREWTDADGATECQELGGDSRFCLAGLRELLQLVEALKRRATENAQPTSGADTVSEKPDSAAPELRNGIIPADPTPVFDRERHSEA